MNICTVLGLLIGASLIQGLFGLPVDRELFRVKRKGEAEIEHDAELARKVRRSQDDRETEIRHKRRFFVPETTEHKTEVFATKMEARSSRSSREDNDITAKRPERFRIRKRSPDEGESSSIAGETSGAGGQIGKESTFGSGLWSYISVKPVTQIKQVKQAEKRSTNSLGSLLSALKAISSLASEEPETSGQEVDSSGSGLWLAREKEIDDDKLPKFFEDNKNSGSGENPEEALSMINEAAENELNSKVEDASVEEIQSNSREKLFKRELKSDSLIEDDLMAAVENIKTSHNYYPEEGPNTSSGSTMNVDEDRDTAGKEGNDMSGQTEEDHFGEKPEVETKSEVKLQTKAKSIRSITDVIFPDSFYRTRRSSEENAFLVSEKNLGVNDALDSSSLVARFYRDQDAHAAEPESIDISAASLSSETKPQAKAVKSETFHEHSGYYSEPRLVYTREIRNAPEAIIERPAIFSHNYDEREMDSSLGGEDGEDEEATLTIHEREIREDGYVGCFEDKSPDRDLPTVLSVPQLTPDSCRGACQGAGHAYAGVQYGYLCRCGDTYGRYTKVPDEECNALCSGDKAQKCGGFWRSAIFTTAGAMQPSKRGNFFHIDSIQPITEDIFDTPRSEIPSGDDHSGEIFTTVKASDQTAHVDAATQSESSGATTHELHRETSIQESQLPSVPGVSVEESPMPAHPEQYALKDDTVAQALTAELIKDDKALSERTSKSSSVNNPAPAQNNQRADTETSHGQVTVALDSTNQDETKVEDNQRNQTPQGTHASQFMYLHQQQHIASKPTPKAVVAVQPSKVEAGTVAYTGTIKLKQSWLDQFEDADSADSKILSGNIEQAFKRVFKNEPKFVNAEVMGLREGLVKHNPNTIRKVIAPFILTFKNGASGIEEKLKRMVKNTERLDDMPVYKSSLQIAEYGHAPAATRNEESAKNTVNEKQKSEDEKRSAVNIPKRPYTMQLFLMKDLFGKKKRSIKELKE